MAASLILLFPYSGVVPDIFTEQTPFFFFKHGHHLVQDSMLPRVFTYLCSILLWIIGAMLCQPHEKARPSPFPFSWDPESSFWSLRPKEEKWENKPGNPFPVKGITVLTFPLSPLPNHREMTMQSREKRSTAHNAGRGRTHQSVHSLHRTPALQACHSSCSC